MTNKINRERSANPSNQTPKAKARNEKNNKKSLYLTCIQGNPPLQHKRTRRKLTSKEIEVIKKSREKGISNKEICKRLGISYPTLANWVKRLDLPKKYEGERERNLRRICSAVERLGCCTIKELSEETGTPPYTIDKYISYLLRRGEIGKIAIRRGGKSKLTHRGTELFGETAGLVLFYLDKKEAISRLLNTITKSQDKGIKCALTHYLKNFGFTKAEIEEINKERITQESTVNLHLKIRDIENLSKKEPAPTSLMNLFILSNIQIAFL
jgi:transposase